MAGVAGIMVPRLAKFQEKKKDKVCEEIAELAIAATSRLKKHEMEGRRTPQDPTGMLVLHDEDELEWAGLQSYPALRMVYGENNTRCGQ